MSDRTKFCGYSFFKTKNFVQSPLLKWVNLRKILFEDEKRKCEGSFKGTKFFPDNFLDDNNDTIFEIIFVIIGWFKS